jgi:hypothetical protein
MGCVVERDCCQLGKSSFGTPLVSYALSLRAKHSSMLLHRSLQKGFIKNDVSMFAISVAILRMI